MWYENEMIIYALISVGILAFLILIYFLFRPKYKSFKEMQLYGVIWKWRWNKDNIYDLNPHCPLCLGKLFYDDESAKIASTPLNEKITFLICENCNGEEKGRIKGGDRKYVLNIVKSDILKLVKTQKFKEILDARKRI
ncbi:MAG: hypothetical protein CR967_00475 [Proteobacteria bacterium]|nr:MAG: hypothetical protein CR967_00475 [Pseudomonadota bacterium]